MHEVHSLFLAAMPSTLRGGARLADMFGKLDEYRFSDTPDFDALKNDWEIVGKDIRMCMQQYGQRAAKTLAAS